MKAAIGWVAAAAAVAVTAMGAGAGELPLQLKGEGAHYTLRVPLDVRAQAKSGELDDLRVLNGAGESLPFAWLHADPEVVVTPNRQSVPLFKAPKPPAASASATTVTPPPSQQGGWIVDLRAVKGMPQELQLDVAQGTNGIYPFVLEASDDLQQWRTIEPDAQLVALQHQGLRLEHGSFELGRVQGGYLRLRPAPGGEPVPITAARVTSLTHRIDLPDWQWSEPLSPTECKPAYCDYVLPRHLPLQRVEFTLAQSNTLAHVQLLADPDEEPAVASSRVRHHHPVREHLKVLRHKEAPPASPAPQENFWPLSSGTVYALNLKGREVRDTVMSLPGGMYRTLRVQPTGGMAQLGAVAPKLRVAGRAQSLVFLARGAGPYRLAWQQTSPSVSLPLSQLMPGRLADDPLPDSVAVVAPSVVPVTPAPVVAASAPADAPAPSTHKLWLWAALFGALALMGFMAWSLLKPAAKSAD